MRKQDLALMKQLKREDEKAKVANLCAAKEEEAKHEAVSFDTWWNAIAKKLNLQFHIKEIMWADFSARGLKREDDPTKYNEALKLFGY